MEIGGCLALIPVFVIGSDKFDINQYISFIVPYFKDSMNLMLVMGAIYGVVRVIGAVGLWKNRMWGLEPVDTILATRRRTRFERTAGR